MIQVMNEVDKSQLKLQGQADDLPVSDYAGTLL